MFAALDSLLFTVGDRPLPIASLAAPDEHHGSVNDVRLRHNGAYRAAVGTARRQPHPNRAVGQGRQRSTAILLAGRAAVSTARDLAQHRPLFSGVVPTYKLHDR